jgi:hypothetical protein
MHSCPSETVSGPYAVRDSRTWDAMGGPSRLSSCEVHKRPIAVPFSTVLDLEAWGETRSGEAVT